MAGAGIEAAPLPAFWRRLLLVLVIFVGTTLANAQWGPLVSDPDASQRIAWWREARVGMFLHWGLYSIPGRGEWVQWAEQIPVDEYAKLADQFRPEHFDADAWAAIAKTAGMEYMVLTARHHDDSRLLTSRSAICLRLGIVSTMTFARD
jgi:alpha-L-fucosidase